MVPVEHATEVATAREKNDPLRTKTGMVVAGLVSVISSGRATQPCFGSPSLLQPFNEVSCDDTRFSCE